MPEMKYLIVSNENNCVYTYTPRLHTALALADGNVDAVVHGVTYANTAKDKDYEMIVNRDLFYHNVYHVDIGKTMEFTILEGDAVSDSWRKTREILRARQEAFFFWETMVHNSFANVHRHIWQEFDIFVDNELSKCDPENNKYEWSIEECARIMGMDTEHAYKEMKLEMESNKLKMFRIELMAQKWKNEINSVDTRDELTYVKQRMSREFWKNAMI